MKISLTIVVGLTALLQSLAYGQIVDDWSEVTLRFDGKELKPIAVPDPPLLGKRFAEGWMDLTKDNTIQVRADTGGILREIALPEGSHVAVTSDDRVAAVYPAKSQGGVTQLFGWISEPGKIGPGRLRALELGDKVKWVVFGASVADGREGFLLGMPKGNDERGYKKIRLKVFSGEAVAPVFSWEQDVQGGEVSLPGAYLWAARSPRQATPGLLPLVACGDKFLVTPGPQEPVYCIDPNTPDKPVFWKLEKPWEFRRGFTGPSVWAHHLSRFGIDSFKFGGVETLDWETFVAESIEGVTPDYREKYRANAEAQLARLKVAEADLQSRCQITGGPFVVAGKDQESPSIFIAVAEADHPGVWARYLSHTLVYEVGAMTGKPAAIIHLPRNPLGSEGRVQGDGVVWRCEENGIAMLEPSVTGELHFGPGGPDCIGKLRWYIEATPQRHDAWLNAPATGSGFVWTDTGLLAAIDDCWVEKEGDKKLLLPICDFGAAGRRTSYVLQVPLKQAVKAPGSNYSSSGGNFRTTGPYLLGITALDAWNKRLYVTLGYEGGFSTLVFDSVLDNSAEQGGAGQPATRPESKSEGSDKPQPGSEGRSR